MQILRDSKSMLEAARTWLEPELRELLSAHVNRLSEYGGYDLSELVNFIVFEGSDTVADLDSALGFSIMSNRFDDSRYGEHGFSPSWDALEEYINWFELVCVLSDDGFGVVVLVEKHSDPELLKMLSFYSNK